MKWHFPAALLTICSLALLIFVGFLQRADNAFDWMIVFGLILLSVFGAFFSVIWLLVALAAPSHKPPMPPQTMQTASANRLPQSEFSKTWLQNRHAVTYDENVRQSREGGIQAAHRLTIPGDEGTGVRRKKNGTELWRGFRDINEDQRRGK